MYRLRYFLIIHILFVFVTNCWSTVWAPAYPYEQNIQGQKVIVKAIPYDPFSGSPMKGKTQVFFDKQLLYSIDCYYRELVFTSPDGKYFIVVHTSNTLHFRVEGQPAIDFNQVAFEIFKFGKIYKRILLKDAVDTVQLAKEKKPFPWDYTFDFDSFNSSIWGCDYCKKEMRKREFRNCMSGVGKGAYCEACKSDCDSMEIFKVEKNLYDNSIFVKDSALFVVTNLNNIVKLDLHDFSLERIPFQEMIPDKKSFSPPRLTRKHDIVRLPHKFAQPKLKNGKSFESSIAEYLGLTVPDDYRKANYTVHLNHLVINIQGKCVDVDGDIYNKKISEYYSEESRDKEKSEKLKAWIREQTFDTKLIPRRFDAYSFLCIVDLE